MGQKGSKSTASSAVITVTASDTKIDYEWDALPKHSYFEEPECDFDRYPVDVEPFVPPPLVLTTDQIRGLAASQSFGTCRVVGSIDPMLRSLIVVLVSL
jgi:hypothetical protein